MITQKEIVQLQLLGAPNAAINGETNERAAAERAPVATAPLINILQLIPHSLICLLIHTELNEAIKYNLFPSLAFTMSLRSLIPYSNYPDGEQSG
jgi:hypothetical protein